MVKPGDESYPFRGPPELLSPLRLVHTLRLNPMWIDSNGGASLCEAKALGLGRNGGEASAGADDRESVDATVAALTDGSVLALSVLQETCQTSKCAYIGLRADGDDGFSLNELTRYSLIQNSICLEVDEYDDADRSIQGADLDFFTLDSASCIADLHGTLSGLRRQLEGEEVSTHLAVSLSSLPLPSLSFSLLLFFVSFHHVLLCLMVMMHVTRFKQLLGALMFSCLGRGPGPRLSEEPMVDAKVFEKHFSGVPLALVFQQ